MQFDTAEFSLSIITITILIIYFCADLGGVRTHDKTVSRNNIWVVSGDTHSADMSKSSPEKCSIMLEKYATLSYVGYLIWYWFHRGRIRDLLFTWNPRNGGQPDWSYPRRPMVESASLGIATSCGNPCYNPSDWELVNPKADLTELHVFLSTIEGTKDCSIWTLTRNFIFEPILRRDCWQTHTGQWTLDNMDYSNGHALCSTIDCKWTN